MPKDFETVVAFRPTGGHGQVQVAVPKVPDIEGTDFTFTCEVGKLRPGPPVFQPPERLRHRTDEGWSLSRLAVVPQPKDPHDLLGDVLIPAAPAIVRMYHAWLTPVGKRTFRDLADALRGGKPKKASRIILTKD